MNDLLEQIRKLYYRTSKATIVEDFDRAVDLLKAMSNEDERERATVYMQGLAEMKAEWIISPSRASAERRSAAAPPRFDRSKRGGRPPRSND